MNSDSPIPAWVFATETRPMAETGPRDPCHGVRPGVRRRSPWQWGCGAGPSRWCSPTLGALVILGGLGRFLQWGVEEGKVRCTWNRRKMVLDFNTGEVAALTQLSLDNWSLEGGAVLHALVWRGIWCGKDLIGQGDGDDYHSLKGAWQGKEGRPGS
jgi:hypothetical protein